MVLLRYTLLRLLLFAVVLALCWIVGLRGFALAMVAILVSGLVSLIVLRRPREEVSIGLSERLSRIRSRMDRTSEEDAWDEQRREVDEQRREA